MNTEPTAPLVLSYAGNGASAHGAATGHHVSWSPDGRGVCHTCGEQFEPVVIVRGAAHAPSCTIDVAGPPVGGVMLDVSGPPVGQRDLLATWPPRNRRQRRADAARARRRR